MAMLLHMRGLPAQTSEASIRGFFRGYDIPPDGILIPKDGYAFVQFSSSEDLLSAIEKDGAEIQGQSVAFLLSTEAEKRAFLVASGDMQRSAPSLQVRESEFQVPPPTKADESIGSYSSSHVRQQQPYSDASLYSRDQTVQQHFYLEVGSIDPTVTAQEVKTFFGSLAEAITPGGIVRALGNSPAVLVEFNNEDDFKIAQMMNGRKLRGRPVSLRVAHKSDFNSCIQAGASSTSSLSNTSSTFGPQNAYSQPSRPYGGTGLTSSTTSYGNYPYGNVAARERTYGAAYSSSYYPGHRAQYLSRDALLNDYGRSNSRTGTDPPNSGTASISIDYGHGTDKEKPCADEEITSSDKNVVKDLPLGYYVKFDQMPSWANVTWVKWLLSECQLKDANIYFVSYRSKALYSFVGLASENDVYKACSRNQTKIGSDTLCVECVSCEKVKENLTNLPPHLSLHSSITPKKSPSVNMYGLQGNKRSYPETSKQMGYDSRKKAAYGEQARHPIHYSSQQQMYSVRSQSHSYLGSQQQKPYPGTQQQKPYHGSQQQKPYHGSQQQKPHRGVEQPKSHPQVDKPKLNPGSQQQKPTSSSKGLHDARPVARPQVPPVQQGNIMAPKTSLNVQKAWNSSTTRGAEEKPRIRKPHERWPDRGLPKATDLEEVLQVEGLPLGPNLTPEDVKNWLTEAPRKFRVVGLYNVFRSPTEENKNMIVDVVEFKVLKPTEHVLPKLVFIKGHAARVKHPSQASACISCRKFGHTRLATDRCPAFSPNKDCYYVEPTAELPLSPNNVSCSIYFKGRKHKSIDQASLWVQALAMKRPELAKKIIDSTSKEEIRDAWHQLPFFESLTWEKDNYLILKELCTSKYEKSATFREALLRTGNLTIFYVHVRPSKGVGSSQVRRVQNVHPDYYTGLNLYGRALMNVREEMRSRPVAPEKIVVVDEEEEDDDEEEEEGEDTDDEEEKQACQNLLNLYSKVKELPDWNEATPELIRFEGLPIGTKMSVESVAIWLMSDPLNLEIIDGPHVKSKKYKDQFDIHVVTVTVQGPVMNPVLPERGVVGGYSAKIVHPMQKKARYCRFCLCSDHETNDKACKAYKVTKGLVHFFKSDKDYELSPNCANSPINFEGVEHGTVVQAYVMKEADELAKLGVQSELSYTSGTWTKKEPMLKANKYQIMEWEADSLELWKELYRIKWASSASFRQTLSDTGDMEIVFIDARLERGCGLYLSDTASALVDPAYLPGLNLVGKALMAIRKEKALKSMTPVAQVPALVPEADQRYKGQEEKSMELGEQGTHSAMKPPVAGISILDSVPVAQVPAEPTKSIANQNNAQELVPMDHLKVETRPTMNDSALQDPLSMELHHYPTNKSVEDSVQVTEELSYGEVEMKHIPAVHTQNMKMESQVSIEHSSMLPQDLEITRLPESALKTSMPSTKAVPVPEEDKGDFTKTQVPPKKVLKSPDSYELPEYKEFVMDDSVEVVEIEGLPLSPDFAPDNAISWLKQSPRELSIVEHYNVIKRPPSDISDYEVYVIQVLVRKPIDPVMRKNAVIGGHVCKITHASQLDGNVCIVCRQHGHTRQETDQCPAYGDSCNVYFVENIDTVELSPSCFSGPVEYEGFKHASVNHAYLWKQASDLGRPDVAEKFKLTFKASEVRKLWTELHFYESLNWELNSYHLIKELFRLRWQKSAAFRTALRGTGNKMIMYIHIRITRGIGMTGLKRVQSVKPEYYPGLNMVGHALMELRQESRSIGIRPVKPVLPVITADDGNKEKRNDNGGSAEVVDMDIDSD